jgi:hypothetical protein
LSVALVEIQEARVEAVRENGRRSAHNILDELAETFEDVWRLRQRVRAQLDKDGEFDPVPLRLLCDAIAQARATCQVAVNINHLAIEGERLRMEQEQQQANAEGDLRDALTPELLAECQAGLIEAALTKRGLDAATVKLLVDEEFGVECTTGQAQRLVRRLLEGGG